MRKKFETNSELNNLLPTLQPLLPRLLLIYYSIKNFLTGKTDEVPIVYADGDWPNHIHLWTMIKISPSIGPIIVVIPTNEESIQIDQIDRHLLPLMSIIEQFDEFSIRFYSEVYTKKFCELLAKQHWNKSFKENIARSHMFYLNDALKDDPNFINERIDLPDGFEFCALDVEKDSKLLCVTWPYSSANEIHRTKAKLRHFPSVGIRYIGDDEQIIAQIEMPEINPNRLVAFEIIDPAGHLNHQYTSPRFRNRGFGMAVERRICQLAIVAGLWPYKSVGIDNRSVIAASMKSPLWKPLRDAKNQPLVTNPCGFRRIVKSKN